jgi:hypothetical protein
VQNRQTFVAQTPGSGSLTLTHAGNIYQGTVDGAADFTVPPTTVSTAFVVSIAGKFSTTGFTAVVTVDPLHPPCEYKVQWIGTKDGAPNTIP